MSEKYLYFRTVTDQDSDDGADDSIYIPVKAITGFVPTSTTVLTIYYESLLNQSGNSADDENVISDYVAVTCTQGKVKQAMMDIIGAINANRLYNDGVIVVADDVTTTYLTSAASADETVTGQYLGGSITACGAITTATVLS